MTSLDANIEMELGAELFRFAANINQQKIKTSSELILAILGHMITLHESLVNSVLRSKHRGEDFYYYLETKYMRRLEISKALFHFYSYRNEPDVFPADKPIFLKCRIRLSDIAYDFERDNRIKNSINVLNPDMFHK